MSIVNTFHKATPVDPAGKPREWWYSDEAKDHRAAQYLYQWLKTNGTATNEPDTYPAFWLYDIEYDRQMWVKCDRVLWLRDFTRAYPDQINKLAREMLNATENR